jgi:adenine deaminase
MLIIKNGTILDVKNSQLVYGDISILDGKIKGIEKNIETGEEDTVIDAQGKIVAPGFIDALSSRTYGR